MTEWSLVERLHQQAWLLIEAADRIEELERDLMSRAGAVALGRLPDHVWNSATGLCRRCGESPSSARAMTRCWGTRVRGDLSVDSVLGDMATGDDWSGVPE